MQFTIVGREVDRDVAWSVLSDTDGMNRVAGNAAVISALEHGPDGPVVVGEMVGPMGMRMAFRETGGWIDQRWFRQERVFSGGPVSTSRFVLELEPSGLGVRPKLTLELEGPLAFRPLLAASLRRICVAWQRVLEGLPAPGERAVSEEVELPAEQLQALSKWSSSVEPAIVAAFRGWFAEGSALELQSMRPFLLADRWGLDRESVLVAMLRGVRSGVFELYWSV